MTDFAAHMEVVARRLLVDLNRALSNKDELRFGSRGSMAIDLSKGTWFDHEAGEGGGVLDLIARQTGHANGAAIRWLSDELGIDVGDSANDKSDGLNIGSGSSSRKGQGKSRGRIVKTYDYRTENGELLFQVCRFEPKDFRQRRPDGNGDWIWSVKGVHRVPYRLPDMLKAVHDTVIICEGERDCDGLASNGFVATTCVGGANKWTVDLNEHFRAKTVYILPDNDDAGRKHAQDVARNLHGIADSVSIVELPGLPPKGDVSDWLDAGGDTAGLINICKAAPKWEPEATNEHDDEPICPIAWTGIAIPERQWLIDGWIPSGRVTGFMGPGGVGKSLLGQQLQTAVAINSFWCGLPTNTARSFGVYTEDEDDELHRRQHSIINLYNICMNDERLKAVKLWSRVGKDARIATVDASGTLKIEPFFYRLLDAAKTHGTEVLVLDNAGDLFLCNQNDESHARLIVNAVCGRLAAELDGATVILLRHPSRAGMASGDGDAGSVAWTNATRSRLYLDRIKSDGDENGDDDLREMSRRKANYGPLGDAIRLRWQHGVLVPDGTNTGDFVDHLNKRNREREVEVTFLKCLHAVNERGQHASDSSASQSRYAPKLFRTLPDGRQFSKREFEAAMHRLFDQKKIRVESVLNHNRDYVSAIVEVAK